MRTLSVAILGLVLTACSGGGSSVQRLADVSPASAVIETGTPAATCPGGTDACGGSGYCCPTGTACLADPANTLCGEGYCCLGCTSGTACGAGCCATGTSCVPNPGGATGCSTGLCCSPKPEETTCPVDVAAQCAAGTRCLANHSAKSCSGGFACYLPSGVVSCPGEVMCPNAVDFCPQGSECSGFSGVCPVGSSSGNYCCKTYAQAGESCDSNPCASGLSCVDNPHCGDTDPSALKTCKGPCGGGFPYSCGNFCCEAGTAYCGAADSCTCYYY